jgi:hypothetical protein
MSWLYSQALVEASLGDIFLDGEQSVPLSGNNTQQAYCAPDKMTAFSRLFRFGMTYKPLMDTLGEELLTLYLEDFHAKTSQPRGEVQELMENDQECGEKWRGSFTKFDPNTSSWKTHQCSLLGGLDDFSESWPQWGLMRDGECWEQQTLAQTIKGTESGLLESGKWATPDANMGKRGYQKPETLHLSKHQITVNDLIMKRYGIKKLNPQLCEWLMDWPLEWTDLKPLEMDKFQLWLQQHGES